MSVIRCAISIGECLLDGKESALLLVVDERVLIFPPFVLFVGEQPEGVSKKQAHACGVKALVHKVEDVVDDLARVDSQNIGQKISVTPNGYRAVVESKSVDDHLEIGLVASVQRFVQTSQHVSYVEHHVFPSEASFVSIHRSLCFLRSVVEVECLKLAERRVRLGGNDARAEQEPSDQVVCVHCRVVIVVGAELALETTEHLLGLGQDGVINLLAADALEEAGGFFTRDEAVT